VLPLPALLLSSNFQFIIVGKTEKKDFSLLKAFSFIYFFYFSLSDQLDQCLGESLLKK